MSYPVYLLRTLGAPRDHHCIFVELEVNGSGFIFQVSGNIQTGMEYNHRNAEKPENVIDFFSKSYLGTVPRKDYESGNIQHIVETVPPPRKQFDGSKRIDTNTPLKRCQEWVAEAVQALKEQGTIQLR